MTIHIYSPSQRSGIQKATNMTPPAQHSAQPLNKIHGGFFHSITSLSVTSHCPRCHFDWPKAAGPNLRALELAGLMTSNEKGTFVWENCIRLSCHIFANLVIPFIIPIKSIPILSIYHNLSIAAFADGQIVQRVQEIHDRAELECNIFMHLLVSRHHHEHL